MIRPSLRAIRLSIVVVVLALCSTQQAAAQTLSLPLFERYVEALRQQAAIPGIAAAVLQDGRPVWEHGFGRADLDTKAPVTADTPFAVGGLTQSLSSALLLRKCVDQSYMTTLDPVRQWVPEFSEPATRVGHLLAHAAPGGGFKYDPARFGLLSVVAERCTNTPYSYLLQDDLFTLLAMNSSLSSAAMATVVAAPDAMFTPADVSRFADIVNRTATPYKVVSGRAQKADVPPQPADASTGVITTVRDLERFDQALRDDYLLEPETRQAAWSNVTSGGQVLPTGFGWFVQNYQGEPVVWQFGLVKDAWSSLIVKLPNRDITLILLANSDGLAAPFALENGDVTTSLFAKTFLRIVLP